MKKVINYIIFVLLLTFFLNSCRMDVVEPITIESEVNQPLQDNRINFISYELVAEDYSGSASIPLTFSVSKARIFMSLIEHNTGSVLLEIKNANQQTVFHTEVDGNIISYFRNISDPNLSRLYITHQNFSGKFKIQISSVTE